MARWKPLVRKDSYMPNNKMTPLVIGNGYTTDWGANGLPPVYETVTGNPVSFSTVQAAPLRQLKVAFSPVQDLHGYDSPWPAGGGKNYFNSEDAVSATFSRSGETFTNTATDTRTGFVAVASALNGTTIVASSSATSGRYPNRTLITIEITSEVTSLRIKHSGATRDLAIDIPFTKQGKFTISLLATSTDVQTIGGLVIKDIMVADYGYSSPWVPYENICPISGWDSLNVEQRGKNLWDEEVRNGYYDGTGVFFPSAAYVANKNMIPVAPSTTYNFRFGAKNGGRICLYDADKNFVSSIVGIASVENYPLAVPNNVHYVNFDMTSAYGATYNNDISINYPATDTEYHAYNPLSRSISITLGQTVYSGYVDVVTGVGEITTKAVDMGDLGWVAATSGDDRVFYAELKNLGGKIISGTFYGLCSCYARKEGPPYVDGHFIMYGSTSYGGFSRVGVRDDAYSEATAAEFKASVAGQTLVFELETPIPIQLTPQEVESLAGDNTMWSNANQPITVTYRSN